MRIEEHVRARDFDPARYSGVFFDNDSMTVLCWNLSGQCVGYQTYCPDGYPLHIFYRYFA